MGQMLSCFNGQREEAPGEGFCPGHLEIDIAQSAALAQFDGEGLFVNGYY